MSVSWLAQIVFFSCYFVGWLLNEVPHTTWLNVTAIAALIIAILLLVDNRSVLNRN